MRLRFFSHFLRVAALAAAALSAVVSCNRPAEQLETGRYYSVMANGNQYFVWLDEYDDDFRASGHLYSQVNDTLLARRDLYVTPGKKKITVLSGGSVYKFKPSQLAVSPYVEPDFRIGDLGLYRTPKSYEVTTSTDIVYGKAQGYWTSLEGAEQDVFKVFSKGYLKSFKKRNLDLTLDLYKPADLSGSRPLIMFMHGGAFYIGYKNEPAYIDFCKYFASMGYVTASINYRLGFHVSKKEITRAEDDAIEDAQTALKYLKSHASEYGIDPDRIFVAGSSAGSIAALNLAFDKKADVLALANMWGAVTDLDILKKAHTSIVSFHGDADNVVPYAEGYPLSGAGEGVAKMLSDKMYGSSHIDKKAGEIGLRHHLFTFPGEGHALNTDKDKQPNKNHTFIKEKMADFFFEELIPVHPHISSDGHGLYFVEGDGLTDIMWKVDGGFALPSSVNGQIRVLWCDDQLHDLTAVGKYKDIEWMTEL